MPSGPEFRFECTRCSACCRGAPGYVFLTASDLDALAAHLGMGRRAFLAEHCRLVDMGGTILYSLREKANFDCAFWEDGCKVYLARPLQCRTYPFWERIAGDARTWADEALSCPGIGRGPLRDPGEVESIMRLRSAETLIGPDSPLPGT